MPELTTAALAGSALAPIVGGLIGKAAAGNDQDAARQMQLDALKNIQGVSLPDIDKMKLQLQQYQLAGQLTPQMEQLVQQNPSLMSNISTDPRLKNSQMDALNRLTQLGKGNLQPEDIAALAKTSQQANADAHAKEQAILSDMQARGQGGSGNELAARLASAQAAAGRENDNSLNVGAGASQRALQATMNAGTLGGQLRSQDFGEQSQVAQAQDAINRFNAANRQQVYGQNTQMSNQAQAQNLAQKQNLMNQNTGLSNDQQKYNSQLQQQDYENRLRKAQGVYSGQQTLANQNAQQAQNTQQMWGGIGQGVGSAAGGAANYMNQQNWLNRMYPSSAAASPAATGNSVKNNGVANDDDWTSFTGAK